MTAQTSYSIRQPVAYAGQITDLSPRDIISRSIEGAAAAFGLAVSRGTNKDRQAVVGSADYIGVTVRALDQEGAANTGAIKYENTQTAAIMREGTIWAICPTGCTPGDAVKCTTATGVLDAGAAGIGETQIDNAFWDSTGAAGEVAVLVLQDTNNTAGS